MHLLKILIHDRSGHPFQVQLSRELARRGHTVLHSYAEFFQTPKGKLAKQADDPEPFVVSGITLDEEFQKYSFRRQIQERQYAHKLVRQIQEFQPKVVIYSNTPPDALAYVYKKLFDGPIKQIFWVQDLYGIAIQKILRQKLWIFGDLVGGYYSRLERRLLRQSQEIVLITDDFLPLMQSWRVSDEKISVIPNWAPLEDIPLECKRNSWSEAHQLHDKFCIVYSGTLGMKHNPDLLLQLAFRFREIDNVRIVVVSEGLGADWLKQKKNEQGLDNLILLPFQPFDVLPQVLATADILVAVLESSAGVFSVPSKVLTYLCAGKPLLLGVPKENLAARIVQRNGIGIVVDPGDAEGFVDTAIALHGNAPQRAIMSAKAREYAEAHFDIEKIATQFEKIILR